MHGNIKFQVLLFIMFKCPMSHKAFFYIIFCECKLSVWVICGPFGIIANAPIFPANLFPNVPHSKLFFNHIQYIKAEAFNQVLTR